MSGTRNSSITVALRKVSSGHRVCAFQMEDLNHAFSIAKVLVRSPEYSRCYAVATDWQGDPLFNVTPEQVQQAPAPYQAPAPPQPYHQQQGYPQQPQYALPAYAPQPGYPQPVYAQPSPYGAQGRVIDAEFEVQSDPFAPPPGYPALMPGGRR